MYLTYISVHTPCGKGNIGTTVIMDNIWKELQVLDKSVSFMMSEAGSQMLHKEGNRCFESVQNHNSIKQELRFVTDCCPPAFDIQTNT